MLHIRLDIIIQGHYLNIILSMKLSEIVLQFNSLRKQDNFDNFCHVHNFFTAHVQIWQILRYTYLANNLTKKICRDTTGIVGHL
jgi:hypothetical protein